MITGRYPTVSRARNANPVRAFAEAGRSIGLDLIPDRVIADGQWHHVPLIDGAKAKLSGGYVFNATCDEAHGFLINHKNGSKKPFRASTPGRPTAVKGTRETSLVDAAADVLRAQHAAAATFYARLFDRLQTSDRANPYLQRKGVAAFGLRYEGDVLVMPLRDASGRLWNVQRIYPDSGDKRLGKGGKKTGLFHLIGQVFEGSSVAVLVVEGYATGASLFMATGLAVAVAVDAGNLPVVARALAACYGAKRVVVCADADTITSMKVVTCINRMQARWGMGDIDPDAVGDELKGGVWNSSRVITTRDGAPLSIPTSTEWRQVEIFADGSPKQIVVEISSADGRLRTVVRNAGRDAAEAAALLGCRAVSPKTHNDWNDVHAASGLVAVRSELEQAIPDLMSYAV